MVSQNENTSACYFIMPRYGQQLFNIFIDNDKNLSNASILEIGLKILNILEVIHESGFVYNDLKLQNILVDYHVNVENQFDDPYSNIFKNIDLKLVDYGLATSWVDPRTGCHIEPCKTKLFRGNMYFSSVNQLKYKTASRRDDLHSLAYLMIYLLNGGVIEEFDYVFQLDIPFEKLKILFCKPSKSNGFLSYVRVKLPVF